MRFEVVFIRELVDNNNYTKMITVIMLPAAKLLQSCPALCDPIDGSPLGSLVLGILQARILEWVAIAFSVQYNAVLQLDKW